MGVRRFGRVNWLGLYTLARREVMRFMNVWQQTVLAPLMTAGLFVVVFALALGKGRGEVMGLSYLVFLGPGILMMTVIQNAFANTSSSIISAKMQGNIVDTLMPPLSAAEILAGYLIGALVRALIVATVIATGMALVIGQGIAHPLWALAFVLLGALLMGGLGLIGGIVAQKFDQMAAITNFIVTPLSFLSGTFYSVEVLPQPFRALAHWNPIFYLIDGARYGIAGVSDAPPLQGLIACGATVVLVLGLAWRWLDSANMDLPLFGCHDRSDRPYRPSPTLIVRRPIPPAFSTIVVTCR
jgi:ABC-2 type transport system permease protein